MNELLDAFGVRWQGRSALVLAPDAAAVGERLRAERGLAAVDALDAPERLDELKERSYDAAVVGDLLYLLSPTPVHDVFRWLHDHLRPGGEVLVETRTYLDSDGGGLRDRVRTPHAHLAFAAEVVDDYYASRGWDPPPPVNCMCRATYFLLFRRAGLELEDVRVQEAEPGQFADKLRFFDPAELRAGRLRVRLRRPDEESELRALRAGRVT